MTWPLGPLSGSIADTDSSVVPGWAPSKIFSVKLETPKGRNRGALSFTSNTFMVSLAATKTCFTNTLSDTQRRHMQVEMRLNFTPGSRLTIRDTA